jgi:RNA polymerase sigma-70 factor, ECF subfamily
MNTPSSGDVTRLLLAWRAGDREAFDQLVPLVYEELRRIARGRLQRFATDGQLQPTALVHEAYIRLVDETQIQWQNRGHFFAIAANTIRRILVDDYRRRKADKRGGAAAFSSLDDEAAIANPPGDDWLALNEALDRLAALDERQAQIVEMKFFGGMTNQEIADALGVALITVERDWRAAKAWLRSQLAQ